MTSTARDVLTRRHATQRGSSDLVFPNPYRGAGKTAGGVVPYDSAREAIMRAIAKARVKPGTPHDLRHTFARWLVRQPGIPVNVVQAALGHADLKTTQRYLTMDGADMAGMFDAIGLGGGEKD
jgi:integrase